MVSGGMKVASDLTFRYRGYPGLSGLAQCNHRSLKWKRMTREEIREKYEDTVQKKPFHFLISITATALLLSLPSWFNFLKGLSIFSAQTFSPFNYGFI